MAADDRPPGPGLQVGRVVCGFSGFQGVDVPLCSVEPGVPTAGTRALLTPYIFRRSKPNSPAPLPRRWIKSLEQPNGLRSVAASSPTLLATLESAVRAGLPVLVEDVGEGLDAALDALLARAVVKHGEFPHRSTLRLQIEKKPPMASLFALCVGNHRTLRTLGQPSNSSYNERRDTPRKRRANSRAPHPHPRGRRRGRLRPPLSALPGYAPPQPPFPAARLHARGGGQLCGHQKGGVTTGPLGLF